MFCRKRNKHGLFVRIALLFLGGLFDSLIIALIAGRILYTTEERPKTLAAKYIQGLHSFLMKELPSPATTENLKQFAARHDDLEIAVWKKPTLVYSSLTDAIDPERFSQSDAFNTGDVRMLRLYHRLYAMGEKDGVTFIFCYDFNPTKSVVAKTFLILQLLIIVIFLMVYRFVMHQLAPLNDICRGTQELSLGHFHYRLPEATTAEFDELVQSFNTMAEKLETTFVNNTLMIGNLSHDLKSHLTRLRMSAEVDLQDPEIKKSLVEDIQAIDTYLERTLQAFRISSNKATYQLEPVFLHTFVAEVLSRQEALHPGRLVTRNFVATSPAVLLDKHFFSILLVNLLENAFQYGSAIVLSIMATNEAFKLEIRNQTPHDLPPEDVPFLSQPFFRSEKARQIRSGHSGLGLYIARQIAETHQFSFAMNPEPSLFTVIIEGPVYCRKAFPVLVE